MFQQIQQTFSAGMTAMRNDDLSRESVYLKEIEELKQLIHSLEAKIDSLSLSQRAVPSVQPEDGANRDPLTLAAEVRPYVSCCYFAV